MCALSKKGVEKCVLLPALVWLTFGLVEAGIRLCTPSVCFVCSLNQSKCQPGKRTHFGKHMRKNTCFFLLLTPQSKHSHLMKGQIVLYEGHISYKLSQGIRSKQASSAINWRQIYWHQNFWRHNCCRQNWRHISITWLVLLTENLRMVGRLLLLLLLLLLLPQALSTSDPGAIFGEILY